MYCKKHNYIECWDDKNSIFAYIETDCPLDIFDHIWGTFTNNPQNIKDANRNEEWNLSSFIESIEKQGYQIQIIQPNHSVDMNVK